MPSEIQPQKYERALLLNCVNGLSDDNGNSVSTYLVGNDFDWDLFVELTHKHKIGPLVYRRLSESELPVPEPVMTELESSAEWVAFRNLNMVETLYGTLELFEEYGIHALAYKGPALTASVHQDIAFRYSGDLDVLLSKDQVIKAYHLLLEHGFRAKRDFTEQELQTTLRSGRHISVIDTDGIRIELHWRVTGGHFPFPVDFEKLWARREYVTVGGRKIPILSPNDLVVLLAVHGNRHCWTQLAWLCDFAGVVETYEFDWEQLLMMAAESGTERMLLIGMRLANDIVGSELPVRVQQRINTDKSVIELARRVEDTYLWEQPQPLSRVRYMLQMQERTRDQIRTVGRLAFLPNEKDYNFLPPRAQLYPLAYLSRPIRLALLVGRLSYLSLFRQSGDAKST